jgi:hypothetical protein
MVIIFGEFCSLFKSFYEKSLIQEYTKLAQKEKKILRAGCPFWRLEASPGTF